MNDKKSKTQVLIGTIFLLVFYIAIILFVFLEIIHIDTLKNFWIGMIFEFISFLVILFLILGNIMSKNLKVGYFIPLVMVTIVYSLLVNILNMALIATITISFLLLLNCVLLFVYCLIAIPMFVMGKNKIY